MPNEYGLPTEAELARNIANSIFDLSGLDDDTDGIRLQNQKECLLAFAEAFREMDSKGNDCNVTLFSGLFFVLADESKRLALRAQMSASELQLIYDALNTAALRVVEGRRRAA